MLWVSFVVFVGFSCGVFFVFSLLNFGFAPDERSSHQGGGKRVWDFFAWWVWFFIVLLFLHFYLCDFLLRCS